MKRPHLRGVWIKFKRGLWHRGTVKTRCGLRAGGVFPTAFEMPKDLGKICYKCRRAVEKAT